jgi:pilus assembly protein CpaC
MKDRGHPFAIRNILLGALSFSAAVVLMLAPALAPAWAGKDQARAPAPSAITTSALPPAGAVAKQPIASTAPTQPIAAALPIAVSAPAVRRVRPMRPLRVRTRFLPLGVGKSVVVNLPRDAKDVLVADPKIANAVIHSARRAYIIGAAVGQTNVVFFGADGNSVASYDIAVKRDLNGVQEALQESVPGVHIEGVGDGVILTGSVQSPVQAQQADDIAARLVGGADKVVNSIVVRGRDEVLLKVTVAEVRRDIVKQLGIDLSASMNYGTAVVNFNNSNPFTALGQPLVSNNGLQAASILKGAPTFAATLRALESAGVVRTLAEPNLTAISGESATFISGGEFPIPAGYSCDPTTHVCTTQIAYKKFGISLNFTPVVLSAGRISLHVMTEVSELSNDNAITISQALSSNTTNSITIPSIRTRRADTTLEIPSGGSMAMAGLIQEQTKRAVNGLPGVDRIPVLGQLFRSQDYVNDETELMVLVTPYIVRPVPESALSRPDDGFVPASDSQSALLAQINRIYGVPARVTPAANCKCGIGFIID